MAERHHLTQKDQTYLTLSPFKNLHLEKGNPDREYLLCEIARLMTTEKMARSDALLTAYSSLLRGGNLPEDQKQIPHTQVEYPRESGNFYPETIFVRPHTRVTTAYFDPHRPPGTMLYIDTLVQSATRKGWFRRQPERRRYMLVQRVRENDDFIDYTHGLQTATKEGEIVGAFVVDRVERLALIGVQGVPRTALAGANVDLYAHPGN